MHGEDFHVSQASNYLHTKSCSTDAVGMLASLSLECKSPPGTRLCPETLGPAKAEGVGYGGQTRREQGQGGGGGTLRKHGLPHDAGEPHQPHLLYHPEHQP